MLVGYNYFKFHSVDFSRSGLHDRSVLTASFSTLLDALQFVRIAWQGSLEVGAETILAVRQ